MHFHYRRFILSVILIIILAFIWVFFYPRTYHVQNFVQREGTKFWTLNTGSKIGYYKVEGSSETSKSPIIYIHGGPGGLIKDQIIEALQPLSELGHDLYFYDQIGSGHSARLEHIKDYTVDRHRQDLEEIIDKIISDQVIIIGHSWGCMLAINYIQSHPEKVERIILESPGPILPINKNLKNIKAPDSLELKEPEFSNAEGNRKVNHLRSHLIDKWAYIFNAKLASDEEVDDFFTYLNEELSKSTYCDQVHSKKFQGGGGYYAHIMTVKSFSDVKNEREKLKNTDIPVLIIRGQCDNQKWGYVKEYLDLLPKSKIAIIKNTGHDLITESKNQYYKLIEDFVSNTTITD